MKSATIVNIMKIQREYVPTFNPNAAPGLCTSVKRIQSPKIGCGSPSKPRRAAATAFVQKSTAVTNTSTGQKSPALLLCIFLTLFAIDAIAGVGQRIEPLERDLVAALVALAEALRAAIQPAQRFVDVPQEAAFLAREEERLLAFHRVRSLIRHVKRIAAQIAVGVLRRASEHFVGAAELLEHALALVE